MNDRTGKKSSFQPAGPDGGEVAYASHCVRLTAVQWVLAGAIALAVATLCPVLAQRVETFVPAADYRIPYHLSEDYWLYEQLSARAVAESKVLVIGDSVIWGQYVSPDETLTSHLNAAVGRQRFANLGVNGTHPIALAGLMKFHGRRIRGSKVVLHFNPLWMSSPTRDLQTAEKVSFNHPALVPQFVPWIPSYRASIEKRLAVVTGRLLPQAGWAEHVRLAYLDNSDLPAWTVEHPRGNPFDLPGPAALQPEDRPRRRPVCWTAAGLDQADFAWVDPDSSFQWRAFRRSVELLTERGNEVFVCVGPLNEHMLTASSRRKYAALRERIERWLKDSSTTHFIARTLPSSLYADASHPLSEGYAMLATQLLEDESFTAFCARPGTK